MADWEGLKSYIRANYKVADDSGSTLSLLFATTNGRSQIAVVSHLVNDLGESWVKLESPLGTFAEINLGAAIRATEGLLCGGIGSAGEYVTLSDSFPLVNLDVNEFESPLTKIVQTADRLEAQLTGGADRH